jgi:hypothetical protein
MPIESSTKTDEIVEASMLFRNHHADGLEYLKMPK